MARTLLVGRTVMSEHIIIITVRHPAPCEMWCTASVIAFCAHPPGIPGTRDRIRRVDDDRPYPSARVDVCVLRAEMAGIGGSLNGRTSMQAGVCRNITRAVHGRGWFSPS
ncbi:hypothetical protein QE152_g9605 [Popillia japonica]|uniref:Uncharacterized protein n=1 Tax=Popillia japonica TaxID=7064 RepID=A0AAW1LXU7_POPJA